MITWMNILKKTRTLSLLGFAAGLLLLNASQAIAETTYTTNCAYSGQQLNTCDTVKKMQTSGSSSPLAQYGNTCTTKTSACSSSSIQSVSYYQKQNKNSCFQSMPVNTGSITSVVGMRPTHIGASSSSCMLDTDTGVKMRQHAGMDVGTACETPIQAPADGVIDVQTTSGSSGIHDKVVIRHPLNTQDADYSSACKYYYTIFLHNSIIKKSVGTPVQQGDTVALVGDGHGNYGCHMHMELRKCSQNGEILNPLCDNNKFLCNNQKGSAQPINPEGAVSNKDYGSGNSTIKDSSNATDSYGKTGSIGANSSGRTSSGSNQKSTPSGTFEDGGKMVDFETSYRCNIADNSNSVKGCMFCDLFKTIFNVSSQVANKCHTTFADAMIVLVAIGLAISLASIVLPYMSNMMQQDQYRLLNNILQRIFTAIVIILLLKIPVAQFFDMFITPIFKTGMNLADLAISQDFGKQLSQYGFDGIDDGGLPKEMALAMLRSIYAIQVRLEHLWALGSNSICIALHVKSFHHYPIFPHFGYLITGVFMWLTAVVFMVVYPFLLIDSVLQFAIAAALFPIALASTAFKLTRSYLNVMKVVNVFMNAMFIFIFLTIVMFILLSGIDEAVRKPIEDAFDSSKSTGLFGLKDLGWFSQTFIKLIFFLFLGKTVLEDIPTFAEQFAGALSFGSSTGSADMGIGRKIGGTALRTATKLTTEVGVPAAKNIVRTGAKTAAATVGSVASSAGHSFVVARTRRKAAALATGAAAGTASARGEAWVSGRTWYGQKVQRRVVTDSQGNTVLESRKRSLIGNRQIVTKDDGYMSITRKTRKDGSFVESYKIKSGFNRNLINADGTKNIEALNDLLQNSSLGKEAVNKVILNQMMQQRLSGVKRGMGKEFFRDNSFVSEQVTSSLDEHGREVFEVRRVGRDGYVNVFKMTKGETRDLIEFERIDKNGKAQKWASDGIIQKKEHYNYELDSKGGYVLNDDGSFKIDTASRKVEFSNSAAYKGVNLFDENGNRTRHTENEELMFNQDDLRLYKKQMNEYGDVLRHSTFGR